MSCSSDDQKDELIIFENVDVRIELIGVEDSRCPSDVQCFWEGDAVVTMTIFSKGDVSTFTLNSNPNVGSGQVERTVLGYSISLKNVEPYPQSSSEKIALEEYTISLDVIGL